MSKMTDAITAHRAAWQAFQDAPEDDHHPDTLSASFNETEAMTLMLRCIPEDQADLLALKAHLDWWVVEEDQRRGVEPELFMLHAAITLATIEGADLARREIQGIGR